MNIQPVVEGHGETQAVPVLLRRLIAEAQVYQIGVGRPIRKKQTQLLQEDSLREAVRLARIQDRCGAILILFEHEDECPGLLGPKLNGWAQSEAANVPCELVLAHREYEAWFLAGLESLRGKRGIRDDALAPAEPEATRDAKGALEKRMGPGGAYIETVDQAALSQLFDMRAAFSRSRSFQHFVTAFGRLIRAMGAPLGSWPPQSWQR